jgi:hypothetical protein
MTEMSARDPIVLAALEDFAARCDGRPTPQALIDEAASSNHPLHRHFEWDDSIAGPKYRLQQARQLLNKVKVSYVVENRRIMAPMFMRDPHAKASEQGYISLAVARSQEEIARDIVINEFIRAAAALERAKTVANVLGLTEDIAGLLEQLGILHQSLL